MTTPKKLTPLSFNSIPSTDDALSNLQTLPSLQNINSNTSELIESNDPTFSPTASNSDDNDELPRFLRTKRWFSHVPSVGSLDDVYERIDKFLDEEGLFIACTTPTRPLKRHMTLKPCTSLHKISSFNLRGRANTEEKIEDNSPEGIAVPSFMAKRAAFQRSVSNTSATAPTVSMWNFNLEPEKSRLAISEMPNQEGDVEHNQDY